MTCIALVEAKRKRKNVQAAIDQTGRYAQAFVPSSVGSVHRPEHMAIRHLSDRRPGINRHLHPSWHRGGADTTVLAYEVDDAPAAIALLDVGESERCHLGSSQSATKKDGKNSVLMLIARGSAPQDTRFLALKLKP